MALRSARYVYERNNTKEINVILCKVGARGNIWGKATPPCDRAKKRPPTGSGQTAGASCKKGWPEEQRPPGATECYSNINVNSHTDLFRWGPHTSNTKCRFLTHGVSLCPPSTKLGLNIAYSFSAWFLPRLVSPAPDLAKTPDQGFLFGRPGVSIVCEP
jgi:hypothetical protein